MGYNLNIVKLLFMIKEELREKEPVAYRSLENALKSVITYKKNIESLSYEEYIIEMQQTRCDVGASC